MFVLLVVLLSIAWGVLQFFGLPFAHYQRLIDNIKIARVQAINKVNTSGYMDVKLTLYDKDGQPTSVRTYTVRGDQWQLQARFIQLGFGSHLLYSGYELTPLEGRDDKGQRYPAKPTIDDYNYSDKDWNFDDFYSKLPLIAKVIDSHPVYMPSDGKTYDVFMSSQGLQIRPPD